MKLESRWRRRFGRPENGVHGSEDRRAFLGKLTLFASSAAAALFGGSFLVARAENGANTMSGDGLVTIPSAHNVPETVERLESVVKAKGLTMFASVDHAAGAKAVGLALAPTFLVIFGNAKGGTPLMQADQRVGIDLPLKALVWQDNAGKTWLTYNDPEWIAQRHGLGHEVDQVVKTISGTLAAISKEATT
jgi:uncharacterized protein (DUF302 family)